MDNTRLERSWAHFDDVVTESMKRTLQLMSAFTLILFLWAYVSQLEELTRTDRAAVVPSRQIQVIQSLEGGLIKSIFAQEGQSVVQGEILAEIDDLWAQSQLEKNALQIHALNVRSFRLMAELNDVPFSIPLSFKQAYPQAVSNEQRIYEGRKKEFDLKMQAFVHEILQIDQQILQEQSENHYAKKSYELKLKEYAMMEPLWDSGALSPQERLQMERAIGDFQGLMEQSAHRIQRSLEYKNVLENRREEYRAQWLKDLAAEYARIQLDLPQLEEEHRTLKDKERRTQLRAPVDGIINKAYIHTAGGVLRPGETLFDLVPLDDKLMIEAKINPKDIGFIHKGMHAHVKVSAFDFSLYGGLEGTVEHISPDVLLDRDIPYYLVRVRTDKNYLERNGKQYPIIPGMMASVDILTGHRTVLQYLMKPILKSKQIVMTER
jgi:adhesin transport system membrane fusion protein